MFRVGYSGAFASGKLDLRGFIIMTFEVCSCG